MSGLQDAIYRAEDGNGFDPPKGDDHWYFWSDKERNEWKMRNNPMRHQFYEKRYR